MSFILGHRVPFPRDGSPGKGFPRLLSARATETDSPTQRMKIIGFQRQHRPVWIACRRKPSTFES